MKKFEAGQTVTTRSNCDYDCTFSAKIISRTEKTVLIDCEHIKGKRCKVYKTYDGQAEYFLPFGNYSMAPMMEAK